jgi:hypothetical protein
MTSPSNVIRVPKPPKAAFNPKRLLAKNTLLLNQVAHFRMMELELPPEKQTGMDFEAILTEGQASEYIRKMTHTLHVKVKKSGGK